MVYLWNRCVEGLFAPNCVLCSSGEASVARDLCAACLNDLPLPDHGCRRCGEELTGEAALPICGSCQRRPPRYDAIHCSFRYGYPMDHLIRSLKYSHQLVHARVIGELMAQRLRDQVKQEGHVTWPDAIVPVPMASERYRERGFNQAAEIAKHVSRALGIPLVHDLVMRRRATREQAGLDRKGRRKNIRGAFVFNEPARQVRNVRRVAILDDVVTTGSTVNEIARVLRRERIEHIEVWAAARAYLRQS